MSALEQLTENVESMNKDDIDKIVGKVTAHHYSLTRYGSLLVNETYYWLATESNNTSLWCIDKGGTIYNYVYSSTRNTSWGIRAKGTLVEGVWRTASLQQCKNSQGRHRADPANSNFVQNIE